MKALEGDAKWEKTVDELMDAVDSYIPTPAREIEKPFLMPVEDIFTISGPRDGGDGKNRARQGEGRTRRWRSWASSRRATTVVTGVEMFKKLLDEGRAGDNVGLLLRGVERKDIERGQVIAKPGSITPHTKFKAEAYVLTKEEGGRHTPFFTGYRPQFYFRTTDVTGVAHLPDGSGDGDAGRQRGDGDRVDRADRDGEGTALRDSRRRPHGRRRHSVGSCGVRLSLVFDDLC